MSSLHSVLVSGITTEEQLVERMDHLLSFMGEKRFCEEASAALLAIAMPEAVVPRSLERFRSMIVDGVGCFLLSLGTDMIKKAILAQFHLPPASGPGERLLALFTLFPTLHKLGQIVARNPGIDHLMKQYLIPLEEGQGTSDPGFIKWFIDDQLADNKEYARVLVGERVLAEASVAVIMPFSLSGERAGDRVDGVFKLLKPGVERQLEVELVAMENVLSWLETNRERYPLEKMQLGNLFGEVKDDLRREVDLARERVNLESAARLYAQCSSVRIPQVLPFSSGSLTAMEYIDGVKVTDTGLSESEGAGLARLTFETIICVPLFSLEDDALFHGDPHAGNIIAIIDDAAKEVRLGLIDWTLAGYLSRALRQGMIDMILAIVIGDGPAVAKSIIGMGSEKTRSNITTQKIEKIFEERSADAHYCSDPLKTAFWMLERVTMAGCVFPPELILFRKAFFTLEGVLNDISPAFSPGKSMENYLSRLLSSELPDRLGEVLYPVATTRRHYQSMVSNQALNNLSLQMGLAGWQQAMSLHASLLTTQTRLVDDFFRYCGWVFKGM